MNPHASDHPGMHDPLPIPASTYDFLRPRQSSNPIDLFGTPLVVPNLKKGQRLIGSASVDCADCAHGHTYVVNIVWGESGWYAEVTRAKGQELHGKILMPENPYAEAVPIFYQSLLALVPEADRIPIQEWVSR
jgi:hypothetical protein